MKSEAVFNFEPEEKSVAAIKMGVIAKTTQV